MSELWSEPSSLCGGLCFCDLCPPLPAAQHIQSTTDAPELLMYCHTIFSSCFGDKHAHLRGMRWLLSVEPALCPPGAEADLVADFFLEKAADMIHRATAVTCAHAVRKRSTSPGCVGWCSCACCRSAQRVYRRFKPLEHM